MSLLILCLDLVFSNTSVNDVLEFFVISTIKNMIYKHAINLVIENRYMMSVIEKPCSWKIVS